jgi:hypothetical protein
MPGGSGQNGPECNLASTIAVTKRVNCVEVRQKARRRAKSCADSPRRCLSGGGVSSDGERWTRCRPGFFPPARVLSRVFRGLFLERIEVAHAEGEVQFFSDLVVKIIRLSPVVMPILCGILCRCEGTKRLIHSTSWPHGRRGVQDLSGSAMQERVGGLRQALVRRTVAGSRLSRPLHPTRRHRQQSPPRSRQQSRQLSLEGLPRER